MVVCFELVVNFGDNAEAAQAAARIDPKPWALRTGTHRIPLHRPALSLLGLMAGTLQLARALTDDQLANELLDQGVDNALALLDAGQHA